MRSRSSLTEGARCQHNQRTREHRLQRCPRACRSCSTSTTRKQARGETAAQRRRATSRARPLRAPSRTTRDVAPAHYAYQALPGRSRNTNDQDIGRSGSTTWDGHAPRTSERPGLSALSTEGNDQAAIEPPTLSLTVSGRVLGRSSRAITLVLAGYHRAKK